MAFGAGAIVAKLVLDLSGYAAGLSSAGSLAQGFAGTVRQFLAQPLLTVTALAAEAAHALKQTFLSVAEGAHAVSIEAGIAGVSEGFFKKIAASAQISNIGIDELGHTFAILQRNAVNAGEGNKVLDAAFVKIGVSAKDAAGNILPMEELFPAIVDGISRLPNQADKAQVAMTLLGRGGAALLPILKDGSKSFDEFAERVRAVTGESFEGISEGAHKFAELEVLASKAWGSVKRSLTEPIFEVIGKHAEEFEAIIGQVAAAAREAIAPVIRQVTEWVATHPDEIKKRMLEIGQAAVKAFGLVKDAIVFVLDHLDGFLYGLEAIVAYKVIFGTLNSLTSSWKLVAAAIATANKEQAGFGQGMGRIGKYGAAGGVGAAYGGVSEGNVGGAIGGGLGAWGGAEAGAAIGTAFFPGVGTVIGAIIGAIGGGYGGAKVGGAIDRAVSENNVTNNITVQVQGNDSTLKMAEAIRNQVRMQDAKDENELRAAIHTDNVNRGLGQ